MKGPEAYRFRILPDQLPRVDGTGHAAFFEKLIAHSITSRELQAAFFLRATSAAI